MPASDRPLPPAPRYLIGIDGGGTGTRARLTDAQGQLLGSGEAGPSGLARGSAPAWAQVLRAITAAFEQAALPLATPEQCAIGLGLAGAGTPARADDFRRAAPPFATLVLASDATAALLGAHAGRPGAIVAAGTGSVGLALHADGRQVLVGGWGFGVGDEGGGAWLGQQAAQLAQQALDGRASAGTLARAVWRVAGGERAALVDWCSRTGQAGFAGLAPLVFAQAEADPAARALLGRAADELAAMAQALDPAGMLPLVVTGSVGQRLQPLLPAPLRARCVAPEGDAAQGALRLLHPSLAATNGTSA